jgi:hypothetical protein
VTPCDSQLAFREQGEDNFTTPVTSPRLVLSRARALSLSPIPSFPSRTKDHERTTIFNSALHFSPPPLSPSCFFRAFLLVFFVPPSFLPSPPCLCSVPPPHHPDTLASGMRQQQFVYVVECANGFFWIDPFSFPFLFFSNPPLPLRQCVPNHVVPRHRGSVSVFSQRCERDPPLLSSLAPSLFAVVTSCHPSVLCMCSSIHPSMYPCIYRSIYLLSITACSFISL